MGSGAPETPAELAATPHAPRPAPSVIGSRLRWWSIQGGGRAVVVARAAVVVAVCGRGVAAGCNGLRSKKVSK
jgi:hypothetical protein